MNVTVYTEGTGKIPDEQIAELVQRAFRPAARRASSACSTCCARSIARPRRTATSAATSPNSPGSASTGRRAAQGCRRLGNPGALPRSAAAWGRTGPKRDPRSPSPRIARFAGALSLARRARATRRGRPLESRADRAQHDASIDGRSEGSKRGDTLAVHLDADPSTGFRWELRRLAGASVVQVGLRDYPPETAGRRAARRRAGDSTFRFRAYAAGHVEHRARVSAPVGDRRARPRRRSLRDRGPLTRWPRRRALPPARLAARRALQATTRGSACACASSRRAAVEPARARDAHPGPLPRRRVGARRRRARAGPTPSSSARRGRGDALALPAPPRARERRACSSPTRTAVDARARRAHPARGRPQPRALPARRHRRVRRRRRAAQDAAAHRRELQRPRRRLRAVPRARARRPSRRDERASSCASSAATSPARRAAQADRRRARPPDGDPSPSSASTGSADWARSRRCSPHPGPGSAPSISRSACRASWSTRAGQAPRARSQRGWRAMIAHYASLDRDGIERAFARFRARRPAGGKYAHRATEARALAHPSMKLANPPVGWMLHEGAPRLRRLRACTCPASRAAIRRASRSRRYPGLVHAAHRAGARRAAYAVVQDRCARGSS